MRTPPAGWILVHWPNEAIKLLQEFDVEEISLDHDLGDDQRGTGYDVILWIEEKVALDGFVPPKIVVHSANVSARLKMEQGIKNIIKLSKHYE
ncbi:cyclic-phosphate processing receiver domain-containing protein [Pseudomonas syringae]|uniref:cyclic-phosphate processing receiver domain-containing protein n=1 Tax=Pseudomonas syringae TaxID=317 RepID=UPI001F396FAD|nr:cyclic-phosphate processing receiver domain-containing protein [Pseudomonas syringae]